MKERGDSSTGSKSKTVKARVIFKSIWHLLQDTTPQVKLGGQGQMEGLRLELLIPADTCLRREGS